MRISFEKIKEIRKAKNIPIKDMAKELGYKHYQSYWRIENGRRKISAENLLKISQVLGVDIKELIKEDKND